MMERLHLGEVTLELLEEVALDKRREEVALDL